MVKKVAWFVMITSKESSTAALHILLITSKHSAYARLRPRNPLNHFWLREMLCAYVKRLNSLNTTSYLTYSVLAILFSSHTPH